MTTGKCLPYWQQFFPKHSENTNFHKIQHRSFEDLQDVKHMK